MNMEEFLDKGEDAVAAPEEEIELDVQKAVVEELAADKAKLEENCDVLRRRNDELEQKVAELEQRVARIDAEKAALISENAGLKKSVETISAEKEELQNKENDQQERNPNCLALLDREVELPDRFPGESRDHVIEVIRAARDEDEAHGRKRRAQILEGVLVANEPNGMLASKREALKKIFAENLNVVSGAVIDYLKKEGIPYKKGEDYLSMEEIFNSVY